MFIDTKFENLQRDIMTIHLDFNFLLQLVDDQSVNDFNKMVKKVFEKQEEINGNIRMLESDIEDVENKEVKEILQKRLEELKSEASENYKTFTARATDWFSLREEKIKNFWKILGGV